MVLKVSAGKVEAELSRLVNNADDTRISPFLKQTLTAMQKELAGLAEKIEDFDRQIAAFARKDSTCQRLMSIPGVYPHENCHSAAAKLPPLSSL